MNETGNSHDKLEFRNARAKSLVRSIWGLITGKDTRLYAWDEVRDLLKPRGLVSRGMQVVPIEKIMGSVGRFHDFDNAFLPTNSHLTDRWSRINNAYHKDVVLPPIKLYKVGEIYFVIDGNHRVSVAREHGAAFIDAEVTEALMRVPVTGKDIDSEQLEVLGEYQEFLERTQLDKLRPSANVRFSSPGCYDDLLEHIEKHKYYLGLDLKRDVAFAEGVTDWYDCVYLPLVEVIRSEHTLDAFPGRTEADLYLWVTEHRYYLQQEHKQQESADQVPLEVAAQDYAENFAPKTPFQKVQAAVGGLFESLVGSSNSQS